MLLRAGIGEHTESSGKGHADIYFPAVGSTHALCYHQSDRGTMVGVQNQAGVISAPARSVGEFKYCSGASSDSRVCANGVQPLKLGAPTEALF